MCVAVMIAAMIPITRLRLSSIGNIFAFYSPLEWHYPSTVARRLLELHTALEVDICFVLSAGWSRRLILSIAAIA